MKTLSSRLAWASLAAVAAALLLAGLPAAAQNPQLDRLEQALARRDLPAASAAMNALVVARRPAGTAGGDPLLNGLAGRLYLAAGLPGLALPYLERAGAAEVPAAQRIESQFALAEAQSLVGAFDAAGATLARLEGESLTPAQRRRLAVQAADHLLAGDPAAALARVEPLLAGADAGGRFEAELLASRAHALLGHRDAAAAAAARAWAVALAEPPERLAPLRAALVQAGLAATASNRDLLLDMLNLAGARSAPPDSSLPASLPVCGEGSLTPADHVTIAAYASAFDWQRTMLISASRPQAAAPFLQRLAGRRILEPEGHWPLGTVITLRCRTVASAEYEGDPENEPYSRLFAEHGVYLQAGLQWDAARVAALEGEIAAIAARQGRDHPDLIPLLSELSQRVEWRIRTSASGDFAALDEIRLQFAAAARRLPGGAALVPSEEELTLYDRPDPAGIERLRAAWRSRVERSDLDLAYRWAIGWLAGDTELPRPEARAMVEGLLARFDDRPGDPRRRALLMRLGRIRAGLGDLDGARAAYRAAGAPADSCLVRHLGLNLISGEFGDDDYPEWALRYDLVGRTLIEFAVGADGGVTSQRVILSAPSTIFDEAATRPFAAFRFAPAHPGGRAAACGARIQSVTWRMADPEEPSPNYGLFGIDPT